MKYDVMPIIGTGIYCDRLNCIRSIYSDFARATGLSILDADTAFSGCENLYYTFDSENSIVKLVGKIDGEEKVIEAIEDKALANVFMSISQIYYYYKNNNRPE